MYSLLYSYCIFYLSCVVSAAVIDFNANLTFNSIFEFLKFYVLVLQCKF